MKLTYSMFAVSNKFTAIAYSDNREILITTKTYTTYTEAREELDKLVSLQAPDYELFFFDGYYVSK